jgi:signal transduction histidine kinase
MEKINSDYINYIISVFIILVSLVILIIFFIFFHSRFQKKTKANLEILKSTHEKELLKTQLEIQEETFNKISREIHDNISLALTLSKLQLNNFMAGMNEKPTLISTSIDLISKSLVDLNDISKSLDGNQLTTHGLINTLQSETTVLGKSGIYQVEFEVLGEPYYMDTETELIFFRIFQEACNNIIKHARATRIIVDVFYEKDSLSMKITDNGKGFDVTATLGKNELRKMAGLKNFYTRAKMIGAEVNITSVKNIGTTIHIKKPINSI